MSTDSARTYHALVGMVMALTDTLGYTLCPAAVMTVRNSLIAAGN